MGEAERRVFVMRHDVRASPHAAVLEDSGYWYAFDGVDADALRAIVQRCDGTHDVGEIARAADLAPDVVHALCDALVTNGLAFVLADADAGDAAISSADFCRIARSLIPGWKRRVFEHRLWVSLSEGSAPFETFRSWLLESYHFIEGVNIRLPVAVAFAQNRSVQSLFAHHFAEEYDHGEFFLRALATFGIDQAEAKAAPPLPGTRAILMHMRSCARRDPLQYAVCSGFLESTGEDRIAGRTFFERLAEHYAERPSAIAPLRAHLDLDERYGHNELLEQVCAAIGPLEVGRASAALNAGLTLVETLELWSSDIVRAANPLHTTSVGYRRRSGQFSLAGAT